jgi:excisionase family DNA binding protein
MRDHESLPGPAGQRLSTKEAAELLGVKPETVYAYVSRGRLSSRRVPGGRGSTFDAKEVEASGSTVVAGPSVVGTVARVVGESSPQAASNVPSETVPKAARARRRFRRSGTGTSSRGGRRGGVRTVAPSCALR